jgi:hypothetical protein
MNSIGQLALGILSLFINRSLINKESTLPPSRSFATSEIDKKGENNSPQAGLNLETR